MPVFCAVSTATTRSSGPQLPRGWRSRKNSSVRPTPIDADSATVNRPEYSPAITAASTTTPRQVLPTARSRSCIGTGSKAGPASGSRRVTHTTARQYSAVASSPGRMPATNRSSTNCSVSTA